MSKLFVGVDKMKIQEDMTKGTSKFEIVSVLSLVGSDTEEIGFEKENVKLKREQNVEVWLKKLEDSIRKNMHAKLASFVSKFGEQKANIENRIEGGNKGNNLTDTFRECMKQ